MRILLLSFYYPPDIGPGSLRAESLVDALVRTGGADMQIDVLTTQPNRYQTFNTSAPEYEHGQQLSVHRIALPAHKSGMADQARAFLAYGRAVQKRVHATQRARQWDVVVATSSRLMTASLGAWVAKRVGAKLYLDVRDLFTDTMADVLATSPMRFLMPVFRIIERRTFRSADKLNIVSAGFLTHIRKTAPAMPPTVYTNGIDDIFMETDFSIPFKNNKPVVLYAGNMGQGQGLHHIVPAVAAEMPDIHFKLIGDGRMRAALMDNIRRKSLCNVDILDLIPRDELMEEYRRANILFLHLNRYKAFQKVLPSKIFEYAATKKPMLAGVSGYAAEFLREQVPGAEVFAPCDVKGMKTCMGRLFTGPQIIDRTEFCSHNLRKHIMRKMARDIIFLSSVDNVKNLSHF